MGIYEEKRNNFYDKKYESANLESLEYTAEELADVRLISHINKLRDNGTFIDYADSKCSISK